MMWSALRRSFGLLPIRASDLGRDAIAIQLFADWFRHGAIHPCNRLAAFGAVTNLTIIRLQPAAIL
jgi:hypothetical protein